MKRILLFTPTILWVALALFPRADGFQLSAAFAILVAYPVSLRIDRDAPAWLGKTAAGAGIAACGSFLLPEGPVAAGVAAVWFLFALPNLAYGLVRFLNSPDKRDACVWAEAASVTGPVVGAAALVSSRGWGNFAGFPEPLAVLTVTHFHFTFGLLPAALAALTRYVRERIKSSVAASEPGPLRRDVLPGAGGALWGILLSAPAIGFFFMLRSEKLMPGYAEAGATVALALSVAFWTRFMLLRPVPELPGISAGAFLLASVALTAATGLGAGFSLILAGGNIPATYRDMLRWHGVTNALATLTLAGIAVRHARFSGRQETVWPPDMKSPTTDIPESKAIFRDARVFAMGADSPGRFEAMRDALLAYRFYPASVMACTAAFKDEGRFARLGDRIGMALLVPVFPGLPAIRFPATTEINLLENTPERATLGYVTTRRHYGRGAWSATLVRADGRLRLELRSRMTPTHPLALLGLPFYRFLQKRAHRLGVDNLRRTAD